jgi:hypothetical protein
VRAALTRRGAVAWSGLVAAGRSIGRSAFWTPLFTRVQMLENAEYVQVCPMSGPSFRRLTAFRISPWNKQIGSDDGVFRDQET